MRTSLVLLTLVASACALAPRLARANDSTAQLAAGGLVLVKNDAIEMRAEDLSISAKEVRVTYRFFNRTDRDVTVRVAFPLPLLRYAEGEDVSLPTDDSDNPFAFRTRVNGRPVVMQTERRALVGGRDHADVLRELGVPLSPHAASTHAAIARLSPPQRERLLHLGLVTDEVMVPTEQAEPDLVPAWELQTTHHWEQRFPARAETVIEHRYQPSVGSFVSTSLAGDARDGEHGLRMRARYCVDRALLDAVARSCTGAPDAPEVPYHETYIEYVLTTGANWSGPIGDFRLVVDKGSPRNLLSFCGEGVKKIGPTRFEMRKRNFTPTKDLSILILVRSGH